MPELMWFPTLTNTPSGGWLLPLEPLIGCPSLAGWWAPPRRSHPGSKQEQWLRRPVTLATHPWRQPARQAKKAERLKRTSRRKQPQTCLPLKHTSFPATVRTNVVFQWSFNGLELLKWTLFISTIPVSHQHEYALKHCSCSRLIWWNSIKVRIETADFFHMKWQTSVHKLNLFMR